LNRLDIFHRQKLRKTTIGNSPIAKRQSSQLRPTGLHETRGDSVLFDSSSGEMLPPSLKNIPNRHRDPQKEQIFIDANIDYHNGKGKKEFAPYKFVLPYMEKAGLKFPERTYRLFKVDFRKNNFGKLVRN